MPGFSCDGTGIKCANLPVSDNETNQLTCKFGITKIQFSNFLESNARFVQIMPLAMDSKMQRVSLVMIRHLTVKESVAITKQSLVAYVSGLISTLPKIHRM